MNLRQKITKLVEYKLKHQSKRKCNRLRKKGFDITYTIWWWIAKRIENKKELRYVCWNFAKFYSEKIDLFICLKITDIVVLNKTIFVYIGRPGLIIGEYGENIDKLTEFMNTNIYGKKIENYEILLFEDLRSWNYMFFDSIKDM